MADATDAARAADTRQIEASEKNLANLIAAESAYREQERATLRALASALECDLSWEAVQAQVTALRAQVEQLQQEIAAAREACPSIRMQDHCDEPLLALVNREVSRGFNRDSEVARLAAELSTLRAQHEQVTHEKADKRTVKLGVIEFHPNDALRKRFYHVVNDLREAGCIVDLWLMDIASVLREFGYEMTVSQLRQSRGEPK